MSTRATTWGRRARRFGAPLALLALGAGLWRAGVATPVPFVVLARPEGKGGGVLTYPAEPREAEFSPGGRFLVCRLRVQTRRLLSEEYADAISVWDLEVGREALRFQTGDFRFCDPFFAPAGRVLLVVAWDLSAWEMPTGRLLWRAPISGTPTAVCMPPDGRWVAIAEETGAGGSDCQISIRDAGSGRMLRALSPRLDPASGGRKVVDLSMSQDGSRLAAVGSRAIAVFNTATWADMPRLISPFAEHEIDRAALSGDGRRLTAWAKPSHGPVSDPWVRCVWLTRSGRMLGTAKGNMPPYPPLWGGAGRELRQWGSPFSPTEVRALDSVTGNALRTWTLGPDLHVSDYAPARHLLAATGPGNTVRLIPLPGGP